VALIRLSRRVAAAVLAAALAAPALSACDPSPRVAARLGDWTVTDTELDLVHAQIDAFVRGLDMSVSREGVLSLMIVQAWSEDVLAGAADGSWAELGARIPTPEEFAQVFDQVYGEGWAESLGASAVGPVARQALLQVGWSVLGAAEDSGQIDAELVKTEPANLEVNPRYGEFVFDQELSVIEPPAYPWWTAVQSAVGDGTEIIIPESVEPEAPAEDGTTTGDGGS
jgi:hypothetical protein